MPSSKDQETQASGDSSRYVLLVVVHPNPEADLALVNKTTTGTLCCKNSFVLSQLCPNDSPEYSRPRKGGRTKKDTMIRPRKRLGSSRMPGATRANDSPFQLLKDA